MEESIYIYFTSDLHSYFENWPKLMNDINAKISKRKEKEEFYLLLDNGDHLDRSHPITDASLGNSNQQLLDYANYNAVTLGNNEGITLPSKELYHLYDDVAFDVVCANISPINDPKPSWLKPYHVFTTPENTTIGVIGLTVPFQAFYEKIGWTTEDPFEVLDYFIPIMRKKCGVIVVMSHLGAYVEEEIAKKYPVDVIIGGHTHHLYEQGHLVNDCLITAVGKHGFYYGEIKLTVNKQSKAVESKEGYAIKINDDVDGNTTAFLNELKQEAEKKLSEVVTVLDTALEVKWFEETYLMKQFVKTLQQWTDADCAMLNAGILLDGFQEGIVTKGDVLQRCPHPMNPCTMVLKGDQLIEMIRMVEEERFQNIELKGFGFRGKKIGKMIYSNLTVDYHKETDFVENVFVNDRPVDKQKKYTVATADTFSFPQLVPSLKTIKEKSYFLPELIRDLLEQSLKNV